MNQKDRDKLDQFCDQIVPRINLCKLWPKLLDNGVFNRDDVNIPKWTGNPNHIKTVEDVYLTIKTRGPNAYQNFLFSLRQSGHAHLADLLEGISSNNNQAYFKNSSHFATPVNDYSNDESYGIDIYPDDDYWTKIQSSFEPLKIKVIKATKFLDTPDIKDIERYPMRSNPRGFVLIITNVEYPNRKRYGAYHDEKNLKELFQEMGFEVTMYRDLTGDEIREKVKAFSERSEFRHVHSCFVIISCHGNEITNNEHHTEIEGIDHAEPNYKKVLCTDIMDYFTAEKCRNLAGKPKVFIFQACRGKKVQVARDRIETDVSTIHPVQERESEHNVQPYMPTVRNYTDTFVTYSTIPGYVSFRDTENGSWYIQILCEVFMNHAHKMHLQDLFNMVDSRLQRLRTRKEECQTLVTESIGFSKHCYLNPGLFEDKSENDV